MVHRLRSIDRGKGRKRKKKKEKDGQIAWYGHRYHPVDGCVGVIERGVVPPPFPVRTSMSERLITGLPLIGRLIKSRGERQASLFAPIFTLPRFSFEYLPRDRADSIVDER